MMAICDLIYFCALGLWQLQRLLKSIEEYIFRNSYENILFSFSSIN
jgi:cytochrome oxidase assembly protein ShyY1